MTSLNPMTSWRRFLALANSHPIKITGVAFLVALVCSIMVSFTAVTLRPLQDANRLRESLASLAEIQKTLGVAPPQARQVELTTGAYVMQPAERRIVGMGDIKTVATVYELYEQGRLQLVILPVSGSGYKSTLKGYLALKGDLNTIAALTFYEQDETPGMGSGIMEKQWQALWADKLVTDENGIIRIEVVKGASEGVHEVDGISGATRTGSGVTALVRFWTGLDGYGPYLARLKAEAGG